MNLTTFEIIMLLISILEGGIFIGGLAVSIKFIIKQIDNMEQKQEKTLEAYKTEHKESINLLREDMKKYNNVLERLSLNEREVQNVKHMTDILQNLYNSLLEKISYNK